MYFSIYGHLPDAYVAHIKYGETRIDNNLVENAIRPSAIGKRIGFLLVIQKQAKDLLLYIR